VIYAERVTGALVEYREWRLMGRYLGAYQISTEAQPYRISVGKFWLEAFNLDHPVTELSSVVPTYSLISRLPLLTDIPDTSWVFVRERNKNG
jgi:hypothetical protein